MTIQVLQNVMKFLERVEAKGAEAYAWCEAHQFVQKEIEKLAQAHMSGKIEEGIKAALNDMSEKVPGNAQ